MKNVDVNIITINGVKYTPIDSAGKAEKVDGMPYVVCRTYSAGVFAGYLSKREGKEGTLLNARRIWYWSGASSLSQLAMEGTSKPKECKFPMEVDTVTLTEIIEIIECTEKARQSIKDVPIWKS